MGRAVVADHFAQGLHARQGALDAQFHEIVDEQVAAAGAVVDGVGDILRERRGITPNTVLRFVRYFGTDARSWLNLQGSCKL